MVSIHLPTAMGKDQSLYKNLSLFTYTDDVYTIATCCMHDLQKVDKKTRLTGEMESNMGNLKVMQGRTIFQLGKKLRSKPFRPGPDPYYNSRSLLKIISQASKC